MSALYWWPERYKAEASCCQGTSRREVVRMFRAATDFPDEPFPDMQSSGSEHEYASDQSDADSEHQDAFGSFGLDVSAMAQD